MEQSVAVPVVVPRSVRVKRARWRDFVGVSWSMRFGWLNSRVVHLSVSEQSQVSVYVCMLLAFALSLFLFTLFLSSISLSLSLHSLSRSFFSLLFFLLSLPVLVGVYTVCVYPLEVLGVRCGWVRSLFHILYLVLKVLFEVAMNIGDLVVELVCAYYMRRHTKIT